MFHKITANYNNYNSIFGIIIALLIVFHPFFVHAEGEEVWSYDTNVGLTAYGPYKSLAVTDDGVFATTLSGFGIFSFMSTSTGVEVHKRNTDNTSGWKTKIPMYFTFSQPSPVLIADENGVYVAVKRLDDYVAYNPTTFKIRITKLSPIDGSIIALKDYSSTLYSPVMSLLVDETGLYIVTNQYTGGNAFQSIFAESCANVTESKWIVQKWNKNLLDPSPIWEYVSQESGGGLGDYFIDSAAINSDSIFLGGAKINDVCGTYKFQARLESINKTTGLRNWIRIEPINSGFVSAIVADDSYVYASRRLASIPHDSFLERRSLATGQTVWSKSYPVTTTITSLILGVSNTLIVTYTDLYEAWFGNGGRLKIRKISMDDGSFTGTTTISTGIAPFDYTNPLFDYDLLSDNVKIDKSGALYVAGSAGAANFLYSYSYPGEYTSVKKFNGFDATNLPPVAPNISGPITGTINTVYTFFARASDPEGDTVRYGFDWNNDGGVDVWTPATGYMLSDQSDFGTSTWSTVGIKTFKVLAEDSKGARSGWSTYSINISVTPRLISCPQNVSLSVGSTTNLTARYWSNLAVIPTCSTTGYTDVTNSASWISLNTGIATVSNFGTRGVVGGAGLGNTNIETQYSGNTANTGVGVGMATVPISVSLTPEFRFVRSGKAVSLNIVIDANSDLNCILRGAFGSPVSFSHYASVMPQTYSSYRTNALVSAQKVTVECVSVLNPANTASDGDVIEVIPVAQES